MSKFWSQVVRELEPYVPGEQPQIDGLIKLNTNESPYAPPPEFVERWTVALRDADLNRYPDRSAGALGHRRGVQALLLGQNLGASALPLPAFIAMTGVLALAVFHMSGRARHG